MKRESLLLGLLAFIGLLARLIPQPRTIDDAFITFRYSRNVVEGVGFVYNAGERILGTTTPLYAGLMATFGAIFGGDYPWYALTVNAIAGAANVVLIYLIALQLSENRWIAFWPAIMWAVAPFSVTFAIGGMETSVHNLFMLGTWYAYLNDRPRLVGVGCALGVLTRPDALLWALPLLAHQLYMRIRTQKPAEWLPLNTWGAGLLIYTPWLIFAAAYFGNPIPQTVGTKAAVYFLPASQALQEFLQLYATPFNGQFLLGVGAIVIGIVLYPVLALIGLRWAAVKDPRAVVILSYPWIYALVFSLANPLMFRWYKTPPLPAYFIAIACGVAALVVLIPRERVRQAVLAGIVTVTFLFSLSAWTLTPDHGPSRPAPQMAFHDLELNYERMAKMLRAEYGVTDETILAAGDIGALGYYSRAHIFDTIGLVTDGTTPYYNEESQTQLLVEGFNYAIPPDLILDRQPEYMVVMEIFIRNGLAQHEDFLQSYEPIATIATDYYGTGMLAFRREQ